MFYSKKNIRHKMKRIQVKKHKIGTYEINKISLSCFDDKRQVLDDGIYTLAYFHKDSVTRCKKITDDCTNFKKNHANNKINFSILYVRSSGRFSNILLFFYKDILHRKAYKARKQLLLRYFYTPKSI